LRVLYFWLILAVTFPNCVDRNIMIILYTTKRPKAQNKPLQKMYLKTLSNWGHFVDSPTEPRTTEPRMTQPRKTQPRMD
jgi:hypothetical protein